MIRLLEHRAKAWLRAAGFAVPQGAPAATPAEAARLAAGFASGAVVKALVPAGRRGKAGAVRLVAGADEAAAAAAALIGTEVAGFPVLSVYVEERIGIASEAYLAFVLAGGRLRALASREGGIEIEEAIVSGRGSLAEIEIDPLDGLRPWDAVELWRRAGLAGAKLRDTGALTARLFAAFVRADALMLEVNPLVLEAAGGPMLVGAMAAIDEAALPRHPEWREAAEEAEAWSSGNARERRVAEISRTVPGGECRYVELDGDIGLLVGGGGAGLYQHDRLVALGARPANHCVTPPTGADSRKLKAVIGAILDNPRTRGLLVGFNFAQMARADIRVRSLVEVLDERGMASPDFPIVVRMFGAGEAEARALVAGRPGITYLERGATLDDGVRLVAEQVAARQGPQQGGAA
ncbi:MAG: hypothetical protein IT557_10780 [Alphaproteobacteria bacterium]|nr:hypothetical protein [Alphaproteobacteria bacterium]